MNLKFLTYFTLLIFGLFACNEANRVKEDMDDMIDKTELQLVWSDDFNYSGLPDSSKWHYEVGNGCDLPCGCGWGNKEQQYYTDQKLNNSRVENGHLIIEAHQEKQKESAYTSARLQSNEDWKYGRFEIRAKLPTGRGTWPAIWMLPLENNYGIWPASGEIDIMEHVGYEPDSLYGTVHTQAYNHMIGTQKGNQMQLTDMEEAFHVYAVNWTAEKIEFLVNNQVYHTFKNDESGYEGWPFDQPFHLIMNVAVGGNWGGSQGVNQSIWPQRMEVDYVKVYQFLGNP